MKQLNRLTLDVSLTEGQLCTSVQRSGPAAAPIQTRATRPVALARVREIHDQMAAVLNRANRWGDLDRGSHELLRQHGQLLFDELLPGPVKQILRGLEGGEVTLVLDEALVFVPWELMHTGVGFLGLDHAVGRVIRTGRAVVGAPRPEPDGAWRMLILCDPRGDLMGSYLEGITLRDELDTSRARFDVDLRGSEVGTSEVKRLLREYDLIHFAGHAEIHHDRPADTGWLLSDGVLSPGDLLDLAGGPSFPRVVFSNACRSGTVEGPLVASSQGEAIFSLANAFLLAGVRHYVGTLWDVPDEPACHFALAYYDRLIAGAGHGEAVRAARWALRDRYGPETVLWASYVLYGDPAASAFPASAVGAPAVAEVALEVPRATTRPSLRAHAPVGGRPRPATTRVRGSARAIALEAPALDEAAVWLRRLAPAAGFVAVALVAFLAWWLSRPAAVEARVIDGPVVASDVVASFPAPREVAAVPEGPRVAEAPAVPAAGQTAPAAELVILAQGDAGSGERAEPIPLAPGAALASGDNFQLRFRLPHPGQVTIWHIASQGGVQRVHPAQGDAARVDHVGWNVLPSRDTFYFLDERRGTERFVLAWSATQAPSAQDVTDELAPLANELTQLRRAAPRPMVLRGLGGTRVADPSVDVPAREREIIGAILDVLAARYDDVRVVELGHQ